MLTLATLSPEQRALAAELLYAHKMMGRAPCPGGKHPSIERKTDVMSKSYSKRALEALRQNGGWIRTRHLSLMTGIKQDSLSHAIYRLVTKGLVEKRITTKRYAEWRAIK